MHQTRRLAAVLMGLAPPALSLAPSPTAFSLSPEFDAPPSLQALSEPGMSVRRSAGNCSARVKRAARKARNVRRNRAAQR